LGASGVTGLERTAVGVLVSACNTAAGETPDAEGLSGLARAFFFAGAEALLVSHWAIEDASAQDLMAATLARYAAAPGTSKADALRAAILEMQRSAETGQPFFWAPFELVGAG